MTTQQMEEKLTEITAAFKKLGTALEAVQVKMKPRIPMIGGPADGDSINSDSQVLQIAEELLPLNFIIDGPQLMPMPKITSYHRAVFTKYHLTLYVHEGLSDYAALEMYLNRKRRAESPE